MRATTILIALALALLCFTSFVVADDAVAAAGEDSLDQFQETEQTIGPTNTDTNEQTRARVHTTITTTQSHAFLALQCLPAIC